MSAPPSGFEGGSALVPGELRGYRRFRLTADGLHPTGDLGRGPWSGGLERAVCASGQAHAAPAPECGCGLYGWYHPADARTDSGLGDVPAVIAARGRVVLGDYGFRAAAARIEAVTVPRRPGGGHARRQAERMLARNYPTTRVFRSRRRMVRHHPPADLSNLGLTVRASPASRFRLTALVVWAAGLLALYSVIALPRGALTEPPPALWAVALTAVAGWQALLVWLVGRCAATDSSTGAPSLPPRRDGPTPERT